MIRVHSRTRARAPPNSPDTTTVTTRVRNAGRNPVSELGASLLESLICLLALVVAGFAVFEIAHWHQTRQLAWLTLHEAGRRGAVTGADPQAIRSAVEQSRARHAASSRRRGTVRMGQRYLEDVRIGQEGIPAWHIEILSPSASVFSDFADATLTRRRRLPTISNDYLAEQHAAHLERGWPEGRGPISGKSIFEANTLGLRLTVLHAPLAPGVATLLRLLPESGNALTDTARRHGLLAITIESATAMHSHPVKWPDAQNQRPWINGPEDVTGNKQPTPFSAVLPFGEDAARGHADQDARPSPAQKPPESLAPDLPLPPSQRQGARSNARGFGVEKNHDALCGTLLCCPADP